MAAGLAPRTVSHYLGAIRRAEEWFGARGLDLSQATAIQTADYLESLPRTWATRNLTRASLRHYWEWSEHLAAPVRALRVPPKPRMVCRALDDDDARMLAKAARAHGGREGVAVALALYQGMRREEVATCRWECFSDGWLTIMGKREKVRTIPVHNEVATLLDSHPRQGPYLFVGRGARSHVTPATVWAWFREMADRAGLGKVPTHVGRHTNIALIVDKTGDLRSAQEWAGHESPGQTAGYSRATKRRLQAVVAAIDYDAP